ncbi:unnamed protein product [Umbelopsis ramanniana]
MFEALTEKRLVSAKSISKGILDRDSQLVLVRAPRGNYFQSIGRSVKGTLTLYLEEACFLMNVGQLHIEDYEGKTISFRDLYVAVLNSADGWCSFERYQTYAYLKRLGYHVIRSDAILPIAHTVQPRTSTWMFPITTFAINYIVSTIRSVINRMKKMWHVGCRTGALWVWQRDHVTHPLLPRIQSHFNYASIFSTLRTIPSTRSAYVPSARLHVIDYDVHKPLPTWKKTNPGQPTYRVSVFRASDHFPTPLGLQQLFHDNRILSTQQQQKYPLIPFGEESNLVISVVDGSEGICSFVRFNDEVRPILL